MMKRNYRSRRKSYFASKAGWWSNMSRHPLFIAIVSLLLGSGLLTAVSDYRKSSEIRREKTAQLLEEIDIKVSNFVTSVEELHNICRSKDYFLADAQGQVNLEKERDLIRFRIDTVNNKLEELRAFFSVNSFKTSLYIDNDQLINDYMMMLDAYEVFLKELKGKTIDYDNTLNLNYLNNLADSWSIKVQLVSNTSSNLPAFHELLYNRYLSLSNRSLDEIF